MKKYTRVFMLTLLLAVMLALSAWADGTMVSVSDAQVEAGDTVTVQLSLENNPGVAAVSITLDYDASKLRPVSFDITGEARAKFMLSLANEDAGTVMMVAMKDVSYSGVIAELEFEALSDAAGEAAIGFADVQLCNFADEVVACGSDGGIVQIANDNVPAEAEEEPTEADTRESDTTDETEAEKDASPAKTESGKTDDATETESGDDSAWVQESVARFEQEQAVLVEEGVITAVTEEDASSAEDGAEPTEPDGKKAASASSKPLAKRSPAVVIVIVAVAVVILAAGVVVMLRVRKKDKTARH